jgi:hypothetical protein
VTLAVSAASYHLLEGPIRTGALQRRLARWARWALLPVVAGATAGVVLVSTISAPGTAALATNAPVANQPLRPQSAPTVDAYLPITTSTTDRPNGPIRVLFVGDSLSFTLAAGLEAGGPHYGLDIQDDAVFGCGLVLSSEVMVQGVIESELVGNSDGAAVLLGAHDGSGSLECAAMPTRWDNDVTRYDPDVVVLMDGPWEVRDHKIGGKWIHIGEPGFDRLEVNALETAVRVLGSRGARVVLPTAPYFDEPEQSNGQPWPEDNPARVDVYNRLLRQVAARFPSTAEVIPLGAHISPGGHYASVVDGVDVRDADGIHFTLAGDRFLRSWLLPQLDGIGKGVRK